MSRASTIVFLAFIVPLMLSGCAVTPRAKDPVTEAWTATDNVDGEQRTLFHATSRQYRFDSKSFHPPTAAEDLGLRIVLYEVTTRTTWYQGMDGLQSKVDVRAYLVTQNGKPQRTLWTIQHAGHEFWQSHSYDSNVYIVERGCCDAPDTMNIFDGWSGEFKEARTLPRTAANIISSPTKGSSQ